jgi:hypothetical protein
VLQSFRGGGIEQEEEEEEQQQQQKEPKFVVDPSHIDESNAACAKT